MTSFPSIPSRLTDGELRDHVLVVHVFAPLDGPEADAAYEQVRGLWTRSRSLLGTGLTIADTGLPTTVPSGRATMPQGAVAAQEDHRGDYRLILRRIHDTLNLSMVFAAPRDTGQSRRRRGSIAPLGWIEFDRWWTELAADGIGALLDINHVYQATADSHGSPSPRLAGVVTAALPFVDDALGRDEREPVRCAGFTVWELTTDRDTPSRRRIVAVATAGQDAELSAWTWSPGDLAVPPLASYLLHAAKIRYHARCWNDGNGADQVRMAVDHSVGRLREALARPGRPGLHAARRELLTALAELAITESRTREMHLSVDRARANLYRYLAEPLPADRCLADRLFDQLGDALADLDVSRQRAAGVSAIAYNGRSPVSFPPLFVNIDDSDVSGPPRSRITVRMGFAVDIVSYSLRPAPLKDEAQRRLAEIVVSVLSDLELAIEDTDRQGNGDGMNLFLPPEVELHRALPELLRSWHDRLAADNDGHADRLRLRLAVGVGPVGLAALGFGGNTIVEVSRLLDSDAIRAAVQRFPGRDLAVLVSDQLYHWVVGEGHPGLDSTRFERVEASAKQYAATAWLWSP